MNQQQLNSTNIVSETINNLFCNLFSSIDINIYNLLDDIVFIDEDILNSSFFESVFNTSSTTSLTIVANSFLLGFIIFYCVRHFSSAFSGAKVENISHFIFKLIIFSILINFSYFFCSFILNINSLLSLSIREVGENIFNINITFSELFKKTNFLIAIDKISFNIFTFDGLLKSFISFSFFTLLLSYSIRYILIKVFALITPFAFLSLINSSTSWFFKSWIKIFCSLLLLQSFISIILLIIFSLDFSPTNTLSKIIYLGGLLTLIKSNSFIKDLIGGLNTDITSTITSLKYLLR